MNRFPVVSGDAKAALDKALDLVEFELEFEPGEYPWPWDGDKYTFYAFSGTPYDRLFGPYKVVSYDEKEADVRTTERPKLRDESFLLFISGQNKDRRRLIRNAEVYDGKCLFGPMPRDGFMLASPFAAPIAIGDEFEIVRFAFEFKGDMPGSAKTHRETTSHLRSE